MQGKTAILIGATGLIGKSVLGDLLNHKDYDKVLSFSRKAIEMEHPRLIQHKIDFNLLDNYKHLIQGDDLFCTLGTTLRKAKSREAFWKVDYSYPFQFARLACENNVKQLIVISSMGADAFSSNFYLSVKGEMEKAISSLPFENTAILRPSLLLGERDEFRLGELIGKFFMQLFSFMLIGPLAKYKAIEAGRVARCMVNLANSHKKGLSIVESEQIQKIGKD